MADEEKNEKTEETEAADVVSDTEVSDTEVSDTAETVDEAAAVEEVSDTPAETPVVSDTEVVSDTPAPAEAEAPEEVSDTEPVSDTKRAKSQRHVPRPLRRTRTKTVREKPATRKPITRTSAPEPELGRRQERRGVVVSDKGEKTIVVKVDMIRSHPKYRKVVRRSVKFHAHDETNQAGVGDTVRIVETRPLSKTKRWRLAEIVEKAR
jgi:small subunit ribosomal protein S17